MGSDDSDYGSGFLRSLWRERLFRKPRCPNCNYELSEPPQKADPDKLFLFGFLFVTIGLAAGLEYSEGYAPHVFVFQIILGVGLIAWSIFRYHEMRRRRPRHRRHRTTPRLADILPHGTNVTITPAQTNPKPRSDELSSNLP